MSNTTNFAQCNAPGNPKVEPDPDIAGIGVFVAFVASGWLTLLFCIAYYCINPKVSATDHDCQNALVHPIDKLCLDKVDAFWTWIGRKPSDQWAQALEKAVLGFSDQQSVAGIAILLSGYSQFVDLWNRKSITVYNWQISVDLAWFSSITHLTTLTCLRHYFRQRRALGFLRIACMAVNILLLAVSIGSTGWQRVDPGIPAWCLFKHSSILQDIGGIFAEQNVSPVYNWFYLCITVTFLVFSYLSRIIQLYPDKSNTRRHFDTIVRFPLVVSDALRRPVREWVLQPSQNLGLVRVIAYRLILTIHCQVQAFFDLYSSMLWELTWLLIALVWGVLKVRTDRVGQKVFAKDIEVLPNGNVWGFSQVIATILLILPFISFFEVTYDTFFSHKSTSPPADLPVDNIELADTSLNAPQISDPYQFFRQYHWYRMLILLTYGLSLAVAADLLYTFPYLGFTITSAGIRQHDPINQTDFHDTKILIIWYSEWFSFNIGSLCFFTFSVISVPHEDSRLRLQWIGYRVMALCAGTKRRKHPDNAPARPQKTWIATLMWCGAVVGVLAGSIIFDLRDIFTSRS